MAANAGQGPAPIKRPTSRPKTTDSPPDEQESPISARRTPASFTALTPGSLHIPRTVLEWRIALDSPWRNVHLGRLDQRLILICDHGYSSILAASNLVQLGFYRAGDVIGGFDSWKDTGLPIARCRRRFSKTGALPGAGAPE